jgi:hypothetical protein
LRVPVFTHSCECGKPGIEQVEVATGDGVQCHVQAIPAVCRVLWSLFLLVERSDEHHAPGTVDYPEWSRTRSFPPGMGSDHPWVVPTGATRCRP